ncbi:MAG: HEPN domain-containing protein [Candidatus Acidulodesulfobacterium sp.]
MTKDEIINFWVESSDKDYESMQNMYKIKEYSYALFVGHLVIEKLLKAYYVKNIGINIPRIHDLEKLADSAGLKLSERYANELQDITKFNISVRYDDYKMTFYKKCTDRFTEENIKLINRLRKWLKKKITEKY